MCTVIIQVPETDGGPVRLIAIRDEDPGRPWLALGEHWPTTHPGLVGVKDVRAGGAWLAVRPEKGRLSVLLNVGSPTPAPGLESRGQVVVAAAEGVPAERWPHTAPFSLLTVQGSDALLTTSNGLSADSVAVPPGVHMFVNSPEMDDHTNPRVVGWLPRFRDAVPAHDAVDWFASWFDVLDETAGLSPTADAALIRDNRPHGIPTLSLLLCSATVRPGAAVVEYVGLGIPGDWGTRQPPIRLP